MWWRVSCLVCNEECPAEYAVRSVLPSVRWGVSCLLYGEKCPTEYAVRSVLPSKQWGVCWVYSEECSAEYAVRSILPSIRQGWESAHSLIWLKSNERLWAIRSDRSRQMNNREQIAPVAQRKWATMSQSLRLLMINEQMSNLLKNLAKKILNLIL